MEKRDEKNAEVNFSAIIENTPNGILLVDKETKIQYVNPAFKTMFHCENEGLYGEKAARVVHSDCFEKAIKAGGHLMVKERIPQHKVSYRVGLFPI